MTLRPQASRETPTHVICPPLLTATVHQPPSTSLPSRLLPFASRSTTVRSWISISVICNPRVCFSLSFFPHGSSSRSWRQAKPPAPIMSAYISEDHCGAPAVGGAPVHLTGLDCRLLMSIELSPMVFQTASKPPWSLFLLQSMSGCRFTVSFNLMHNSRLFFFCMSLADHNGVPR